MQDPQEPRRSSPRIWLFRSVALALVIGASALVLWGGFELTAWLFPSNVGFETETNPVLVRQAGRARAILNQPLLHFVLKPYTGFHHPPNVDAGGQFGSVRYAFRTNNQGFLTKYDVPGFSGAPPAPKGSNDRVLLLTGGSAAFGWGASSNDRTFASLLEELLAKKDPRHHWRVYNLAMGGWIAYQEFIGLDLYGSELEPDQIVVFDGRNDIVVHTRHGEEMPNYFFYGGQRKLNELFENLTVSTWDRWFPFLKYRTLAKRLADVAAPVEPITDPAVVDSAVRFYAHAIEAIARRFRDIPVLVMTQPVAWYPNGGSNDVETELLRQGYAKEIVAMHELAGRSLNLRYEDATGLLPDRSTTYLVDDCHLSDTGHAIVAERIAALIDVER